MNEEATEDRRGAEGENRAAGAAGAVDGGRPFARFTRTRFTPGKQLQEQAARAFDPGIGRDGVAEREREIEKLLAKIGQWSAVFLAKWSGR